MLKTLVFAAEGAAGNDIMSLATAALDSLITIAGKVIDFTLTNPILAICFVAGTLVPAGFALFSHGRNAAR